MEVPCPCEPCDFVLDDLDENTFESMEQHVRWIHLPSLDFGDNPMPALTTLMMNGVLRPDEYAEVIQAILQKEFDQRRRSYPIRRSVMFDLLAAGWLVAGCVALEILSFRHSWNGWLTAVVGLSLGVSMGHLAYHSRRWWL